MKGTERLQKHVITQIDHSKVLLQKMKGCVCVKKRLQHVSQRDTSKVVSLSEICEESPKNANHTDLLFVTGQIITYNKNKSSICQSLRTFNNIILSLIKIHTRFILRLFVLRCRILLFRKTYYQNMIQYIYIYDNANIFSFFSILSIQQHAQNRTWTFFSRRTSISPSSANPIYSSCNSQVIHTNKLNTTHQTHTHSHINTIQVKYWTIPQHQRKLRTIPKRRKERLRLRFRKKDRMRISRIWT